MSDPRFSAVPPYARDVVPALGWTLFACRAAWPALGGARAMTTTNWVWVIGHAADSRSVLAAS